MMGFRILLLKLIGYIFYSLIDIWMNRLQVIYFGVKDYRLNGVNGFGCYDVKFYIMVDLISSFVFNKKDIVIIGLENMFN